MGKMGARNEDQLRSFHQQALALGFQAEITGGGGVTGVSKALVVDEVGRPAGSPICPEELRESVIMGGEKPAREPRKRKKKKVICCCATLATVYNLQVSY